MYKGNPDAANYLGAVSLRAGFHVQQYPLHDKRHESSVVGIDSRHFNAHV